MTDKIALGYMKHVYDPLFGVTNDKIQSVLEIGVYQGASLREWSTRFPNAVIYGLEVSQIDLPGVDKTKVIVFGSTNAYTTATVSKMISIRPKGYDIIIDDGPHTLESQLFFIHNYAQLLSEDGVLVLEDIIAENGVSQLLAAVDKDQFEVTRYDMRNKQLDPHLNELWKNGLDVLVLKRKKKNVIGKEGVFKNA